MARRFLGYPVFELFYVSLILFAIAATVLLTVRGCLFAQPNPAVSAPGPSPTEPLATRNESPALPESSPTTIVIRIATYNINFGNTYGDEVLSAISEARADILFLQETTLQSEAFLQPQLASWYPHFYAAGHQGQYAAERFVFASKYPLCKIQFAPPEHGLFGTYSARCDIAGNEITLVNVHLTPVTLPGDTEAAATSLVAGFQETESTHAAEIKSICSELDTTLLTIIAGDFNSLSTFVAPGVLRKLGFVDSFASVHDDAEAYPTWFWPTRPMPLRARIDYIFHSAHFRTASSQVIPRDGSDHYLLVSELQLTQEPGVNAGPIRPAAEKGS